MNRNIEIVRDTVGKKIVKIHDIRFKGKRQIDWHEVKEYLKEYIGEFYAVAESNDMIHIGKDLPDEYTGSKYTRSIKGANAKAKANAAQGIPELIEIGQGRHYRENTSEKHSKNAALGWYRYDLRFAIPVYNDHDEIERYNTYHASMLVRHDKNGKMYLYDIIDIKKETSNPLEQ